MFLRSLLDSILSCSSYFSSFLLFVLVFFICRCLLDLFEAVGPLFLVCGVIPSFPVIQVPVFWSLVTVRFLFPFSCHPWLHLGRFLILLGYLQPHVDLSLGEFGRLFREFQPYFLSRGHCKFFICWVCPFPSVWCCASLFLFPGSGLVWISRLKPASVGIDSREFKGFIRPKYKKFPFMGSQLLLQFLHYPARHFPVGNNAQSMGVGFPPTLICRPTENYFLIFSCFGVDFLLYASHTISAILVSR